MLRIVGIQCIPAYYSTVSSAVQGFTLTLQEDTPDVSNDLEVVCDIDPSSTADYCEVIACNDATTISGMVSLP